MAIVPRHSASLCASTRCLRGRSRITPCWRRSASHPCSHTASDATDFCWFRICFHNYADKTPSLNVRLSQGGRAMKSSVIKRSIMLAGRRTSICLEDMFWRSLREIADARHETLSQLVTTIDSKRQHANLSSAVRLFVLGFYRDQFADYQSRPSEQLVRPIRLGSGWFGLSA
jgi:predicted DNA-binding ribbon-helix-helix protein